jgi:hypothetical protein
MRSTTIIPVLALAFLSGCGAIAGSALSNTASDDRLRDGTARVLDVAPSSVRISERQPTITGVSYRATVGGRRYNCVFALGVYDCGPVPR